MATVYRFKAILSGFIGGPGQNTWHIAQVGAAGGADPSDLEAIGRDIAAVYTAAKTYLPNELKVNIQPIVEGFDVVTGNLVEVTGITAPDQVTGSAASTAQSRATQVCVRLKTDAIRGNRLMQGRHFIGPIADPAMGQDGQVNASARAAILAAYGGILDVAGNGRLVVWGQPNASVPFRAAGQLGYVQQVIVNATPGTLRSRKT